MQQMPSNGIGTFRLKGDEARRSTEQALEIGFRHIDTAQAYDNEEEVGKAIQSSGVARDELFVTTKVWLDNLNDKDFAPSVHESLSKLRLDNVDLLLIHWPSPDGQVPMEQYLTSLAEAREQGLCHHIGVSNFTRSQIKTAVQILGQDALLTNQVELHPFFQNSPLAQSCEDNNIRVTAYMPLAVGKVMQDDTLKAIASEHDATPAQISLAWLAHKGYVSIPSSTKAEHLQQNFAASRIRLSDQQVARIDGLDNGERIVDPDFAPDWD